MHPYPHLRMDACFPDDVYESMLDELPPLDAYSELPLSDAASGRRDFYDLSTTTSPFWHTIYQVVSSTEVQQTILAALCVKRPVVETRVLLMRDHPGYTLAPHTDYPNKVANVLFYLPRNSSQSGLGTTLMASEDEELETFEFAANTAFGFARTETSWHALKTVTSFRDMLYLSFKG